MSQALRKLTGSISKSKTCVIFINQIRMQIGVMFGNPETTAGGRALKFYASVRLDIRRIATLKEGDTAVGNRTKVKVVKNKLAAPFREAEFDILFNQGISREGELIDFAVDKLVIQKAGTWFSFGEERIGQGRENARLFLKEHPDVRNQIEIKLMPLIGLRPPAELPAEAPAAEAPEAANGKATPAKPGNAASDRQPALAGSGDRRR
jgi:recombination protein RecA